MIWMGDLEADFMERINAKANAFLFERQKMQTRGSRCPRV